MSSFVVGKDFATRSLFGFYIVIPFDQVLALPVLHVIEIYLLRLTLEWRRARRLGWVIVL